MSALPFHGGAGPDAKHAGRNIRSYETAVGGRHSGLSRASVPELEWHAVHSELSLHHLGSAQAGAYKIAPQVGIPWGIPTLRVESPESSGHISY